MKEELLNELNTFIEAHYEEAVTLLEELGKIPAPSHKEDLRAAFVKNWFLEAGADQAEIDEAKNVVCRFGCDRFDRVTVFMAHMDVVFDDMDPLPMSRDGDILRAPGIGDDTANLVNLMIASKYLMAHQDRLKSGVVLVANSCEEGLGNLKGSRAVCSAWGDRMDSFYSFDGYIPECTNVPVGSHRYRVTVRVEGGHSFRDFGRENAIHTASRLISSLYEAEPPAAARTTYNVGRIEGGSTVNSIAQQCSFLYEFRSTSQACLQEMEQKFTDIVESFRAAGSQVEVEILGIRPGMGPVDPDTLARLTEHSLAVMRRWNGGQARAAANSTDANIPLSLGIPALTIGSISGDGAHTREEWVDLRSIRSGMGIVLEMLSTCLA